MSDLSSLQSPQTPKARGRLRHSAFALLLLALTPLELGAKGCDTGVVGDDECPEGECGTGGTGGGGGGEICGGIAGISCAEGEFCEYDASCGAGDQTGVCEPYPEACGEIYAPVCGCDGVTYGNACEANMAGVSVASEGECGGGTGGTCGGIAGLACDDGEFCDYPPGTLCGAADQTGTCKPLPKACDANYLPVCGCDDKTYSNACEANTAGVSVAHQGECDGGSGATCGGLLGAQCAADEFCSYAPDAACGFADATGVCTPKPEVCTEEEVPVCGCDGKTYSNACFANAAGVSVAAAGACDAPTGQTCGGFVGAGCPNGQYCNYPPDSMCGFADQTGVCLEIPQACDLIYAPVCGCDGATYGNACAAALAGVSVQANGECP